MATRNPHSALASIPVLSSIFLAMALLLSVSISGAQETTTISQYDHWVTAVSYSPDGSLLASAGGQSLQYRPGSVRLWEVSSGKQLASLEGHKTNVWAVTFSPDGKRLVSCGYDGTVIVWDIASKKSVATLNKHKSWCRAVSFAPDSAHFATAAEDGTVVIWSADGKEVKEFKAHEASIYAVAFHADGKSLATTSSDKTVKFWNWMEGKETGKLTGHTDAVWAIAFSPDGATIATASADRSLRLWKASGEAIVNVHAGRNWITDVAFAADGKTLATSSHDRSVRLWNVQAVVQSAGALNEAHAKIDAAKKAITASETKAAETKKSRDGLNTKIAAVDALIAAKNEDPKVAAAQEALDKDKENKGLQKKLADAKAAQKKAVDASNAKIKALAGDKDFSAILKTLQAAAIAEVEKKKTEIRAPLAELDKQAKATLDAKVAAEKTVVESTAMTRDLSQKQSVTIGEYKSSVWSVAFSPDGKQLATGSHRTNYANDKTTLRLYEIAGSKRLFAPPPAKEEPKSGE
jgi:WD40 repeat protein